MKMKSWLSLVAVLCMLAGCAGADGWIVPDNHRPGGTWNSGDYWSGISVRLIDDLATRSGPSTAYTGCGSYRMNGQYVTALSRAYDNGGVLWIEIEFSYGGGYRRAWTGAKRLDISNSQLLMLPEEDPLSWLGYGTVQTVISPRYGPGDLFSTYPDRNFYPNDQAAVLRWENGYYLVECYHTDGQILRSWIPEGSVSVQ